MTLSEVFYEAACLTSEALDIRDAAHFSCNAVDVAAVGHRERYTKERRIYSEIMSEEGDLYHGHVREAAEEVNWGTQHYRTFMLLMASEAVKC